MTQKPARQKPLRTSVLVEFHPAIKQYLVELGDDTGVSPPKIVRLCIERALPEVEALLRTTDEELPDRLNRGRAGKPLLDEEEKYKPKVPPWVTPPLPPPAIVGVLTGEAVPGISKEFVNLGALAAEQLMPPLTHYPAPPKGEQPDADRPADEAPPPPPKRRRRG